MLSVPHRLTSPSGVTVQVNANGSIRRIDCGGVTVNAFIGNEVEGGPANIWLRRHGTRIECTPLLGPLSPGVLRLERDALHVDGEWNGVRFHLSLVLARSARAWYWHVALENTGRDAQTVDLVHAQDVALAPYATLRLNEYYVSQYVDHTPLQHASRGVALAVRQNLTVAGRHPWLVTASLRRAESFCTDALQLYDLAARSGAPPAALQAARLPDVRHQHEHSMAVLQQAPLSLAAGARATLGFCTWLELDHAGASAAADLEFVERALGLPEAVAPEAPQSAPLPRVHTLFSTAPLLPSAELDAAELAAHFGAERRAVEEVDGQLLSFFGADGAHVVLPAKERASLRPHGQILHSGDKLEPDEASLTSTVWMGGVFHSMVTQGHVAINRFLSTTHSYLGLFRSHGQRVFVERAGKWCLLGEPSAFEMTPSGARWLYRHEELLLEVRSWAALDRHELWLTLQVLQGEPCRFLVSHHVALNGDDGSADVPALWRRDGAGVIVACRPESEVGRRFPHGTFRIDATSDTTIERIGGDELLFADGRSRDQPFVVLISAPGTSLGLRITGQLVAAAPADVAPLAAHEPAQAARFWRDMTGLALQAPASTDATVDVQRLSAILPWWVHDACIHHLAPRGLEQYSGGGWGTRDVCQGPVEFLLSLGRTAPVRALLLEVFRNQNADGDWPQWFMFFARERGIRAPDSHGDIVFWPLLALAQYLLASGDGALLDEVLAYFDARGDAGAERGSVLAHVERALALIERRVIPGTRLAAYGHGDWNDSLQPADPALAEQLCSAWTVTLHHQTLHTLAQALRHVNRAAFAARLEAALPGIRDDFQRLLIHDGVVAGYAHFGAKGHVAHWLHPSDRETGVRYSLLPMVHGILSNLFTREQAQQHVELVQQHLLAPDGARLFDRPLPYHGGLQRRFQRAETSTFFGREIGLMYMHAHLRWAEALAHFGDGEGALRALRIANPVGLRSVVPNARLRQANCYTSSSDALFADRYDASQRYDAVRSGAVDVEGGWRVYSSGAGIAVRLVRERLLGLRLQHASLGIDPVVPRTLDGLEAHVALQGGRTATLRYRVGARGHGPEKITCNGRAIALEREPHPYRTGGVVLPLHELRDGENKIEVEVG
jgi:1,2-beta-oligoglucan phosphorylase